MKKSKILFLVFLFLSFHFSAPGVYAQVYELTEAELQQIEANQQEIIKEAQALKEKLKQAETDLTESKKQLQKAEADLIESNRLQQIQAELLKESEAEKKKAYKIGGLAVIGAFFLGLFIGR